MRLPFLVFSLLSTHLSHFLHSAKARSNPEKLVKQRLRTPEIIVISLYLILTSSFPLSYPTSYCPHLTSFLPNTMAVTKPRRAGDARNSLFKTSSKPRGECKSTNAKTRRPTPPPLTTRKSKRGQASIAYHELIGQYRTEITSSQAKRCGVFSLEFSTSTQLAAAAAAADGGGVTLLPAVFDELFHGEVSQAWHQKGGWTGPDYQQEFYDEQLGLVLYLWDREHGKLLRLGVLTDGLEPFVLPLPVIKGESAPAPEGDDRAVTETVWVHNDNAQLIMGRACNHYSGITILGPEPTT